MNMLLLLIELTLKKNITIDLIFITTINQRDGQIRLNSYQTNSNPRNKELMLKFFVILDATKIFEFFRRCRNENFIIIALSPWFEIFDAIADLK